MDRGVEAGNETVEQPPTVQSTPAKTALQKGPINITFSGTDYILLLGEGDSGKTYLGDKALRSFPRVVVITTDPREFTWCPNRVITIDPETVFQTIDKALEAGNTMVVIDDCDVTISRFTNDSRLRQLLAAGRHRGCGWCLMSRRTQDIPPLAFKQAKHVFIFQTDYPNDLETYRYFYNVEDEVRNLNFAAHECLYINRRARQMAVITA
jgi:hypothetical protein